MTRSRMKLATITFGSWQLIVLKRVSRKRHNRMLAQRREANERKAQEAAGLQPGEQPSRLPAD